MSIDVEPVKLHRRRQTDIILLPCTILVAGIMMMALSVYWDAWWHLTYGRHDFWIPPHIGIYSGLGVSVLGIILTVTRGGTLVTRGLRIYAAGVAGILVAGGLDELWHRIYGVEDPVSLAALWSPTHAMALVMGAVTALGAAMHLSTLADKNEGSRLMGWLVAASFAVFVSVVTLVLSPLAPESRFRLIGLWGAPLLTLIILALRFVGSRFAMVPLALTLMTGFNWAGNAIIISTQTSLGNIPGILCVAITPALVGDIILWRTSKQFTALPRYTIVGLVWGLVFGILFYALTNNVLSGPWDNASLALIGSTSAVAGVAAGILAGRLPVRRFLQIAKGS